MKKLNPSQKSERDKKTSDLLGAATLALIVVAAFLMPHPAKAESSSNKTGPKQTASCTPTPTPPNE